VLSQRPGGYSVHVLGGDARLPPPVMTGVVLLPRMVGELMYISTHLSGLGNLTFPVNGLWKLASMVLSDPIPFDSPPLRTPLNFQNEPPQLLQNWRCSNVYGIAATTWPQPEHW